MSCRRNGLTSAVYAGCRGEWDLAACLAAVRQAQRARHLVARLRQARLHRLRSHRALDPFNLAMGSFTRSCSHRCML